MRCIGNSGQVWVETVVYTLIALIMIGLVLGVAKPKIESLQDKAIIEQSIDMIEEIDSIIEEIKVAPGNKREIALSLKKGDLTIDGVNEEILFQIESKHTYSEPGEVYTEGNIEIITEEVGKISNVNLTRSYEDNYDIQWNGQENSKLLSKTSVPYKIFISNQGKGTGDKIIINFELA